MKSNLRTILCAVSIGVLSSCGISTYGQGFKEANQQLKRPPTDAAGPWQGTWTSKVNGHHGPLWCIVQPNAEQPGQYDFRYRAGWGAIRFGDYTHTVPASLDQDGSLRLEGSMVLPGGFGTYEVKGKLTRDSFTATYHSDADNGTMTLGRPPAP